MATIGLSAYTLRLRNRYSHDRQWPAITRGGNFDGYAMLKAYFEARNGKIVNLNPSAEQTEDSDEQEFLSQRAFKIVRVDYDETSGSICGQIESGEYGRGSSIINVASGEVTHEKGVDEADMPLFYFRVHVPDGAPTSVLVLQRIGISGLRGTLGSDIRQQLATKQVTAKIGALTDRDLFDEYVSNGHLEEIRVLTHKTPADPRQALKNTKINGEAIREGAHIEWGVKQRKWLKKVVQTIKRVAKGSNTVSDLVEIYGLENPDEVIVTFSMDGKKPRRFKLMHPEEIGMKWDITAEVAYNAKKQPVFGSIDGMAKEWCKELLSQVNT